MRGLIIGTGSIGRRHLKNLQRLGVSDLHVYRHKPGHASLSLEGVAVQAHYCAEAAFSVRPDFAIVANPTSLHVSSAIEAAQHDCHILIEKPVSNSLDRVDDLLREVRERNLTAAVAYNLRFHPGIEALRASLQQSDIGEVLSVRAWVGQYLPDWHPEEDYRRSYVAREELGGGVLFTLSHELDYLFWLFGGISEISAQAVRTKNLEMSTESLAEITCVFNSGIIGQIHLDCIRRTPFRGCEVIGTEGTLLLDLIEPCLKLYRPSGNETLPIPARDSNWAYLEQLRDFLQAVASHTPPRTSLEDGLAVLNLILAARRAAKNGIREACK